MVALAVDKRQLIFSADLSRKRLYRNVGFEVLKNAPSIGEQLVDGSQWLLERASYPLFPVPVPLALDYDPNDPDWSGWPETVIDEDNLEEYLAVLYYDG